MQMFLASVVIFSIAFLCLALGTLRGKPCLNCSCETANRIMKGAKTGACGRPLHQLERNEKE